MSGNQHFTIKQGGKNQNRNKSLLYPMNKVMLAVSKGATEAGAIPEWNTAMHT